MAVSGQGRQAGREQAHQDTGRLRRRAESDVVGGKHIYFIRAEQVGMVKIGCSTMPEQRLISLHLVSPVPLSLILRFPGTHDDEWHIHQTFRECRMHCEWFKETGRLREIIAQLSCGVALYKIIGIPPNSGGETLGAKRRTISCNMISCLIGEGVRHADIARRLGCSRQYIHIVASRLDRIRAVIPIPPKRKRTAA